MMRSYIVTILLLVAGACCMGAAAQDSGRRITPVKPSTNTVLSPKKGTSEEVIQQYLSGQPEGWWQGFDYGSAGRRTG